MYVRCPVDCESATDPRVFIMGQIQSIDDFNEAVNVSIHDPFGTYQYYDSLPEKNITLPISSVERCDFFKSEYVMYHDVKFKVIDCEFIKNDYYKYYLQNLKTREIIKVSEDKIIAPFNIGHVSPYKQLKRYEFQNPVWYLAKTNVDKSYRILENSMYGFKELAGCKIYLLPHQVNTVMRCLESLPFRYMLADEVGMGKTIEAISVLKIFILNRSNTKTLIVVPKTLQEQWKSELLFKFNLSEGKNENNNSIFIKNYDELNGSDINKNWDLFIVDEIHKILDNQRYYQNIEKISENSSNVLLLSATPVQQRKQEYLLLLRLLNPFKYLNISDEEFSEIIKRQENIADDATSAYGSIEEYEDIIEDCKENGRKISDDIDSQELFEEVCEYFTAVSEKVNDSKLNELIDKISIDKDDGGLHDMRVILSYICSNYQFESNVIRNRRALLANDDYEKHILPKRELKAEDQLIYEPAKDQYESLTYENLCSFINDNDFNDDEIKSVVMPLLTAFFSSSQSFLKCVNRINEIRKIPSEISDNANEWYIYEQDVLENITDILNDPFNYQDYYNTRPVKLLDHIYQDLYNSNVVIFTSYIDTFYYYRKLLEKIYEPNELALFCDGMVTYELENNVYRFQNDSNCKVMLCDSTGGEGRNFQCADYVVHIDLPWDANAIEQRIGRLDRLERDQDRSTVYSVVIYSKDTFEESLFKFWDEGIKIFEQSLSGLEIAMNDINKKIFSAFNGDFRYDLANMIPDIVDMTAGWREEVKREQNNDTAAYLYKPMNDRLETVINNYSENENEIFQSSMLTWASLAGFHGHQVDDNCIEFTEKSFSSKSAENSLFMPPDWSEYKKNKQLMVAMKVERGGKKVQADDFAIKGTFSRKAAIENDYIHFFAPGDPIFDSIVDNSIHSCKGQSACFAIKTDFNWEGFVYSWSLEPNYKLLIDNGVSIYSLNPFRNFMPTDLIVTIVKTGGDPDVSEKKVIRVYNTVRTDRKLAKSSEIEHMGKRGKSFGFMNIGFDDVSNIEWFKAQYPEEKWIQLLHESRKEAIKQANISIHGKKYVNRCKEEMERQMSAKEASDLYYNYSSDYETEKQKYDIILNAIDNPMLHLESTAFIIMVRGNE